MGCWVVETIAKIRRAYFVQGKAIKAICRELSISRKVVRKVLRSGATEFVYERTVQPHPKLGSWRAELDRLLGVRPYRWTGSGGVFDRGAGVAALNWVGLR